MKKRILSLILVLALCLPLCGCRYLDEMKTARAIRGPENSIILANGTKYMPLPYSEDFCPDFSDRSNVYIVKDEELPLLLTEYYSDYGIISADGQFIRAYSTSYETIYYCREDTYNSVRLRIENGAALSVYCYSYYDLETDQTKLYELTLEQAQALEWVYYEQELEELPTGATMVYDVRVDLYLYSSDHLFRQDTIDIGIVDGKYYLIPSYASIYPVPEELNPIFNEIMANSANSIYW